MLGGETCKLETQTTLASVEAGGKNYNRRQFWCPVKQRIEIDARTRLFAVQAATGNMFACEAGCC